MISSREKSVWGYQKEVGRRKQREGVLRGRNGELENWTRVVGRKDEVSTLKGHKKEALIRGGKEVE